MKVSHQTSEYCDLVFFPMAMLEDECPPMKLPDSVLRMHDGRGGTIWYGIHITPHGYQPDRNLLFPAVMRMVREATTEVGYLVSDKRSLEQCTKRILDTVCVQRRSTINGKTSAIKYFAHLPLDRNIRCCIHGDLTDDRSLERGGHLYSLTFLGHTLQAFVYHLCTDVTERITQEKLGTYTEWHLNNEFGHLLQEGAKFKLTHVSSHTRVIKAEGILV